MPELPVYTVLYRASAVLRDAWLLPTVYTAAARLLYCIYSIYSEYLLRRARGIPCLTRFFEFRVDSCW